MFACLPNPHTPKWQGAPGTDEGPAGASGGVGTTTAAASSARRASAASGGSSSSSTADTADSQASADDLPILPEGDAVVTVQPPVVAGGPVPDRRGSVASSSGTEGGRPAGPHPEQREAAGAAVAALAGSAGPSGAVAAVDGGSSGTPAAQHRTPLAARISHAAADTASDTDSDSGASSSTASTVATAWVPLSLPIKVLSIPNQLSFISVCLFSSFIYFILC